MVKAVFLLPIADNDGRDLSEEIEAVRNAAYDRFTAWTYEGEVRGAYRMADGTPAIDQSDRYMVFLEEARLPELEEILRSFKAKANQEAIYLEIQ